MTVLSENQIENGEYTQDDILDYYEDFHNNDVHRNSLKNLDRSQFDSIDEHREGDYTYTIGTKDGVSVVLETKGFFGKSLLEGFAQNQMDAAETKTKAMQEVSQGIQNFSQGTVFGLAKAYNNTKIILNEASGGRLKQFEDIVNTAGKNFLDIDVKIPIDSLKPEANTIGTMGGEITGQYIIPGAFVYRYIPNIIAAEAITVGLFSGKDDGNLASAIKELAPNFAQNNEVAKIILDGLSVDADDDEVEARIKNITADAPLGILFGSLFSMLSYFKRNPKKLQEVQNEYKDAGAAATPEDQKKNFKSTQPFYSNVVNAIREIDIPEDGMDVTQFTNTIRNTKGIKQSELDDMGFDEFFLDDKPAIVTQERVNEFLETKDLSKNVNTTVLGEADNPNTNVIKKDKNAIDVSLTDVEDYEDATLIVMNNERLYNEFEEFKMIAGYREGFEDKAMEDFLSTRGIKKQASTLPTKFDEYVLPGGEDYREMLLTTKGTQIFTKDHFRRTGANVPEGENILAHIRFNTRTINGKKVLFIEEIQSDLHQAGRKTGYNKITSKFEENIVRSDKVPDAPFKKNWHELSMKRIIKYAIDNGFEGISFTPADIQAERYPGAKADFTVFYDQVLPKFVNKFSKKYNTELTEVALKPTLKYTGGKFNYTNTPLRNAQNINQVYDIVKSDDYMKKEFMLYLKNELNELDPESLIKNANEDEIRGYMNEFLEDDYGLNVDENFQEFVPYLEFTPEMINTIKSEGVPVAALEDRETSSTRTV